MSGEHLASYIVKPKSVSKVRDPVDRNNSHPVDHDVVLALVDELIDDPVNSDGPTDEFELGVLRVTEDKMVAIECGEVFPADAAGQLWKMSAVTVH